MTEVVRSTQSNDTHPLFIRDMFIVIDMIRFVSFVLFAWHVIQMLTCKTVREIRCRIEDVRKIVPKHHFDLICYVLMQIVLVMAGFVFSMVAIYESHKSIIEYRDKIREINPAILYAHTSFKVSIYFAEVLIGFIAVTINLIPIIMWKIATISIDEVEIEENVDSNFFNLSQQYKAIGENTKYVHDAFTWWFTVQYLGYWLAIISSIVELARQGATKRYNTFSIKLLFFDLLEFMIPYIMGKYLNYVHDEYHKKLVKKYLANPFFPDNDEQSKMYYSKAKEKEIKKVKQFNFIPSFLCITTIPLDSSSGYTIGIILFIVAVLYSNL